MCVLCWFRFCFSSRRLQTRCALVTGVQTCALPILPTIRSRCRLLRFEPLPREAMTSLLRDVLPQARDEEIAALIAAGQGSPGRALGFAGLDMAALDRALATIARSEEHTSELQSLMRISYAVFCLKKKNKRQNNIT